jgi:2-oxoglutarate dehydrogenase E1 component
VSSLDDMASGCFQEVLDDSPEALSPQRIIICSGKIFYDLIAGGDKQQVSKTAILRLEQFYPFPFEKMRQIVDRYRDAKEWFWVQEEPENMGGWNFARGYLEEAVGKELHYVGRKAAASPAAGYHSIFKREQAAIVDQAWGTL